MAIKRGGLGKGLDGMFPDYSAKRKKEAAKTSEKTEIKKEKPVKAAPTSAKAVKTVKTAATATEAKKTEKAAPKAEPAVVETVAEAPKAESVTAMPVAEATAVATEPKAEAPKVEAPKPEAPKAEAPKKEASVEVKVAEESKDGDVRYLRISDVEPNREQPRVQFDEEALVELAESIKNFGIIQPLVVQKREDYYEIIAGERRWRAAKLAGLKEVPVIIKDYTPREILEISLIENIQRENLNAIEEAKAYQRLLTEFSLKQEELAQRVSKSRTAITNAMRLLKLDPRVQDMLIAGSISSGHARALLGVENGDTQLALAKRVYDENLSVRDIERIMKTLGSEPKKKPAKSGSDSAMDVVYKDIENKMKEILGTKVSVNRKDDQKGKIEIEYYSAQELERIYDLMKLIRH